MRAMKLTIMLAAAMIAFAASFAGAAEQAKLSKNDMEKYDLAFEKALVHYEKAQLLFDAKKIEEAAKEVKAIIALDFPKGSENMDGQKLQLDMYSFLGEMLLSMKKNKEALEVLKEGIEKAPDISKASYQLHMTLGHAYKEMDNVDKALDEFQKAEKINKKLTELEKKDKKSDKDKKGD